MVEPENPRASEPERAPSVTDDEDREFLDRLDRQFGWQPGMTIFEYTRERSEPGDLGNAEGASE